MLPSYLAQLLPSHAHYTEDDVDRCAAARTERPLLIDSLLEDAGVDSSADVYPPTDENVLSDLFQHLLTAPRLQRDLIAYYLVLDTSPTTAQEFASKRHLTRLHTQRVRGFWCADRGMYDDAVKLLVQPGVWAGFAEEDRLREYQDALLDALATDATPTLVNTFIERSGLVRDSPSRREYFVKALAVEDFEKAWRYIRDLEFEDDMEVGEELDVGQGDEMDLDELEEVDVEQVQVEKRAQLVQDERKRLLAVILDAILIRKHVPSVLEFILNHHSPAAHPNKTALQTLLKLPIDNYEQKFLTSYLLNTTSSLPAASFSLLHDLLTLRLCARGQHAHAIELDRQIIERVHERPELAVSAENAGRAGVQEMVALLPEVQRKMLLVERDAGNVLAEGERVAEDVVENGAQADNSAIGSISARPTTYTRPSFAPLSASTQLRHASNPKNAIYQALLRSTSSSSLTGNPASTRTTGQQRFLPSDHAPASSRRQLNASTATTSANGLANSIRVPFGGQHTQFPSSPFNRPPRVPIGYAAQVGYMHSPGYGREVEVDGTVDDGSVTPREGRPLSPEVDGYQVEDESVRSEREEEREVTPVARDGAEREQGEQENLRDHEQNRVRGRSHSETENHAMDVEEDREAPQDGPTEPKVPAKTPREKRTRQKSVRPTASPPETRAIAKTPARTGKQKQEAKNQDAVSDANTREHDQDEEHAVSIPGAFPTPARMKRKLRSSSQFETASEQPEPESQEPRAKRSRKTAGVDGVRRATRSQSVVSQATEADHEQVTPTKQDSDVPHRRPQRRSARLSESTAASSPARSVISEAGSVAGTGRGGRTRKAAASRETSATPKKPSAPATRGVRTRRQAAALEEEDEE